MIEQFLRTNRFALVGVSRNEKDFSRILFSEFLQRGYDVVPVNPAVQEMNGKQCYPRLQEIVPAVSAALLMVSPTNLETVLADCTAANIPLVWVYGIREGTKEREVVIRGREKFGLTLIAGHCPFMFLPSASLIHRVHRTIWKFAGWYPA